MFRAVPLPETCRVSYRNKFGKLVHLVGFIIKKFVTMHGHMNVKFENTLLARKCCFIFGFCTADEKTKHSEKFSHVRT